MALPSGVGNIPAEKTGIQATPVLAAQALFLGYLKGLSILSVSTPGQEPRGNITVQPACTSIAIMLIKLSSWQTAAVLTISSAAHHHLENAALKELTPDTRGLQGNVLTPLQPSD